MILMLHFRKTLMLTHQQIRGLIFLLLIFHELILPKILNMWVKLLTLTSNFFYFLLIKEAGFSKIIEVKRNKTGVVELF